MMDGFGGRFGWSAACGRSSEGAEGLEGGMDNGLNIELGFFVYGLSIQWLGLISAFGEAPQMDSIRQEKQQRCLHQVRSHEATWT